MRNPLHLGAIAVLLPLGSPALAADIPMSQWNQAPAPVVQRDRVVAHVSHQCVGFLDGRPISNDMLGPMHDAGCCDYLVAMHPDQRLAALEQRLMCEAYGNYQDTHGVPAANLAMLAQPNPPPPPAPVVAPVAPPVAPPVVAPAVVPEPEPEPAIMAPVEPAAPEAIEPDGDLPVEEEEFIIF